MTLVYFNDRPKKIGESGLQSSFVWKSVHRKNYRECFFVWNTDEYDKKKGKDPYTYKRDCDEVLGSWGTLVGKAEGWTVNDTNTLKDLLNKYVVTQKDQSKVGVHQLTERGV